MIELKLTEIERRILAHQRAWEMPRIPDVDTINILSEYIRELEAKAGNSECDELRESLAKEAMLRAEAEKARDRLEADLACSKHEVALLTEELRKAKDRAEAAHLTEQQMMEFAIEKIVRAVRAYGYSFVVGKDGWILLPNRTDGTRSITEAAAAILAGSKGDA
jgi:Skp family chaperone for outer membrane proteins